MGTMTFINCQAMFLMLWFAWNVLSPIFQFDKYPFTFANLFMSAEAAFATPFLLMAANRQAAADRQTFTDDLAADRETLDMVKAIADKLGVNSGTIQ